MDAAAGTLTTAVRVNDETVDKQLTVTDATAAVFIRRQDRRELKGKAGVKAGARVMISSGAAGKVLRARVGTAPKKDQQ